MHEKECVCPRKGVCVHRKGCVVVCVCVCKKNGVCEKGRALLRPSPTQARPIHNIVRVCVKASPPKAGDAFTAEGRRCST